jgi:hypothetical protein
MVALVRRDFERLSELFRSQRRDEQGGKERRNNDTVNRIILYIDDLDRCPPQTVVNVLQAIHLLLAFPIFVVVVAVDSRWVSRSLERCYDWLVPETRPVPSPRTGSNGAEPSRSGPGATAHDYLEKIFQIPFWLAPMDSTACQVMIRGLTEAASEERSKLRELIASAKERQSKASAAAASAGAQGGEQGLPQSPAVSTQPATPAVQSASSQTAQQPSAPASKQDEEIDLAPRQLDVEEAEIKKIDELAALIGRSPRVAKRFLNCYRLLKARMDESELERFLAGPFQFVMEALAIIVGAPSIAREVMDTLSKDGSVLDGKSLIGELTRNLAPEAMASSDAVEVVRLLGSASPDHLQSLRGVVALVSRFSFATHSERAVKLSKRPRKKARTQNA